MKDKPELGNVVKLIPIPSIYSSSLEVLLGELCRIVMAKCDIEIP